ncbi:MAG TPA: GMP/IMP nucleotidase [Gammaproteobacteria bacterium]|nr:GMP/IMP nucleotidase [Gammaproteobacteria bacterium]
MPMIPWQEIDSVYLDMDGTLLDLHFDNHFWREHVPLRYAERNRLDLESAKSELVPRFRLKEGTLDWYCVEYWSRELGLDIVALKREVHHLIAVHEHVPEFLRRVRASGRRVVMLTNAHARSLELKMEVTGLAGAFDALVCSHDLGYPKEDPRFWSALESREHLARESALFIDDSLSVLRTARDYGIGHLLAISKPDSRSPVRDIDEFISIEGFDEIMPTEKVRRET